MTIDMEQHQAIILLLGPQDKHTVHHHSIVQLLQLSQLNVQQGPTQETMLQAAPLAQLDTIAIKVLPMAAQVAIFSQTLEENTAMFALMMPTVLCQPNILAQTGSIQIPKQPDAVGLDQQLMWLEVNQLSK